MRHGLPMLAFTLGLGASWAIAQTAPTGLPDWVAKYANGQEASRRACEVTLAQEQDKTEKLTREVADAKAALAKATAPAAPK